MGIGLLSCGGCGDRACSAVGILRHSCYHTSVLQLKECFVSLNLFKFVLGRDWAVRSRSVAFDALVSLASRRLISERRCASAAVDADVRMPHNGFF